MRILCAVVRKQLTIFFLISYKQTQRMSDTKLLTKVSEASQSKKGFRVDLKSFFFFSFGQRKDQR